MLVDLSLVALGLCATLLSLIQRTPPRQEQKSARAEVARLQRERERPSQLLSELKALREQQASWTTSLEEAEDAKRLRVALDRTEADLARTAQSLSSTQTTLTDIERIKSNVEEELRKERDLVAKIERKVKIQEEEYMSVAKQAKQMYGGSLFLPFCFFVCFSSPLPL